MPKTGSIELPTDERIPILYEDRSVIAIDKPFGWMLAPMSWQNTGRNLQAAITSSIASGAFWARKRNLRYLRNVHRLDAETTGVLLLARSPGALRTYGDLFESRRMSKFYLVVVEGKPKETKWTCRLKLSTDASKIGRMRADVRQGKEAETNFEVLAIADKTCLIGAYPLTGRTHQIRVHLAESGFPVVGDELYGGAMARAGRLALRAVELSYLDPFTRREVLIRAPVEEFLREHGFGKNGERRL